MRILELKKELKLLSNPLRAKLLQRYFKTGKGQYAEGDVFIGLITKEIHNLSKKYSDLSLPEIKKLLTSKIHEERSVALGILKIKYIKGDEKIKKQIHEFYLKHTKYINNWDLVDISAGLIVGDYLLANPKRILLLNKLGRSNSLWERRISIISTFAFLDHGNIKKSFEISKLLLKDKEDLIHKGVGWVLRETGKINMEELKKFLRENYNELPRTTLRYAIERFPERERKIYLTGNF